MVSCKNGKCNGYFPEAGHREAENGRNNFVTNFDAKIDLRRKKRKRRKQRHLSGEKTNCRKMGWFFEVTSELLRKLRKIV